MSTLAMMASPCCRKYFNAACKFPPSRARQYGFNIGSERNDISSSHRAVTPSNCCDAFQDCHKYVLAWDVEMGVDFLFNPKSLVKKPQRRFLKGRSGSSEANEVDAGFLKIPSRSLRIRSGVSASSPFMSVDKVG